MPTEIERKIKKAQDRIKDTVPTLSEPEKSEAIAKLNYLEQMSLEEAQDNRFNEPKVFVSFAGIPGEVIFKEVLQKINQIKTFDTRVNFHALHGMGVDGKGNPLVMDQIVGVMKQCCILVGILTKKYQLIDTRDEEDDNFAPGCWALLEAGMALSLGLPIILLVEEGIHKDFWLGPLGGRRHIRFKPETRQGKLNLLTKRIEEDYRVLRSR